MSESSPIEQLEELQGDIEQTASAIYHAIDAVASSSRLNDDCLWDDIEDARGYAKDMKAKMRKLNQLLDYLSEAKGEEE